MKKLLLKSALVGGLVLSLGGMANATDYVLNMYGASAQFNLWNAVSASFLQTKCPAANVHKATSGKHGIAYGSGCNGGSDTYTIRYSNKASFEGFMAVNNSPTHNDPNYTTPSDNCASGTQRVMCNGGATGYDCTAPSCQTVHVAMSDVNPATFVQQSHGLLNGHADWDFTNWAAKAGTQWVDRDFVANKISTANLSFAGSPLVVPFSFFVNSDVPATNLHRPHIVMIYTGQVNDWTDIGVGAAPMSIVACMRHAGSGTVATLNAAVIRREGILLTTEAEDVDPIAFAPAAWFNDGTGQMMPCINTNGGYGTGSGYGAIGYADADQALSCGAGKTYANTVAATLDGVPSDHDNTMACNHLFWSAQNVWYAKSLDAGHQALVGQLVTYAGQRANILAMDAAAGSHFGNYWATTAEMNCFKQNDFAMPMKKR